MARGYKKGGDFPPKSQNGGDNKTEWDDLTDNSEKKDDGESIDDVIKKFEDNPSALDWIQNRYVESYSLDRLKTLTPEEANALFEEAKGAADVIEQISNDDALFEKMKKHANVESLDDIKYYDVDSLKYFVDGRFEKDIEAGLKKQQETQDEQKKSEKTEQQSEDAESDERSQKIAEMRKALEEDNLLGKCLRIRHNLTEDNIGSDRSIKQYENTKRFIEKYFSEFSVEDYAKHGFDNPVSIEEVIGTPIREMPAAKAKLEAIADRGGEDNAEIEKAQKVAEAREAIKRDQVVAWRMEKTHGITESNIDNIDLDKLDKALDDSKGVSEVIEGFGGLDSIVREMMSMGENYDVDDSDRGVFLEALSGWTTADVVKNELPKFLGRTLGNKNEKKPDEKQESPENEKTQKVTEALEAIKSNENLAVCMELKHGISEGNIENIPLDKLTDALEDSKKMVAVLDKHGGIRKVIAYISRTKEQDVNFTNGIIHKELAKQMFNMCKTEGELEQFIESSIKTETSQDSEESEETMDDRDREFDELCQEILNDTNLNLYLTKAYGLNVGQLKNRGLKGVKNKDNTLAKLQTYLEKAKEATAIIDRYGADKIKDAFEPPIERSQVWSTSVEDLTKAKKYLESIGESEDESNEQSKEDNLKAKAEVEELCKKDFISKDRRDKKWGSILLASRNEVNYSEILEDLQGAAYLIEQIVNKDSYEKLVAEKGGDEAYDYLLKLDVEKLREIASAKDEESSESSESSESQEDEKQKLVAEALEKINGNDCFAWRMLYRYGLDASNIGSANLDTLKDAIEDSEVASEAIEKYGGIKRVFLDLMGSEDENDYDPDGELFRYAMEEIFKNDDDDFEDWVGRLIGRSPDEIDETSNEVDEEEKTQEIAEMREAIKNNPILAKRLELVFGITEDNLEDTDFKELKEAFEDAEEAAIYIAEYGADTIANNAFKEKMSVDEVYQLSLDDLWQGRANVREFDAMGSLERTGWNWFKKNVDYGYFRNASRDDFERLVEVAQEAQEKIEYILADTDFISANNLDPESIKVAKIDDLDRLIEEMEEFHAEDGSDDAETGGEDDSEDDESDDSTKPESEPKSEDGEDGEGGEDDAEKGKMGKVETAPVPKDVLVSRLALSEDARKKMVEMGKVGREDLSAVTAYLSGLEQGDIEQLYADVSDALGEAPKTKEEQDAFKELVTKFENNLEIFDWLVAHNDRIETPDDLKKLSPEEAQALFELGKDVLEIQKEAVKDPDLMARLEAFRGMDAESLKNMDPVEVRRIFKEETRAMMFAELIAKNKDVIEEVLRRNGQSLEFTSVEDLISNKSYDEIKEILEQYKDAGGLYDDLDLKVPSWEDKMENKAKLEKYQELILSDTKVKDWIAENVEGGLDAVLNMGFDELRQVIVDLENAGVIEKTLETKLSEQETEDLRQLFTNGSGRNWILKVHPNLTVERIAAMSPEELKALNDEYEKSKERGFIAVNLACTKEAKELARQLAMKRYEEEIKQKGFIKRMVYNNFMRRATIAKYEKEVLDTIREYQKTGENGGSVEGYWSRDDSIQRFVEAFMEGSESVLLGESETLQGYVIESDDEGEYVKTRGKNGEEIILRGEGIENDPNAKSAVMLRDAIRAYAESNGSKKDEKKFRAELEKIKETLGQTDEISVDNYMELATSARERAQHEKNLDNIMDGFTFINGKAERGIQTESFKTKSEKIAEKLFGGDYARKHPILSRIVSTETALAVADTALAVGTFFFKKAGGLVPVVGRATTGAIVSGLKEKGRAEQDFRNAMRAAAYGETLQTDNKYAEKVKEVLEKNMQPAESLMKMLNDAIISGDVVQMVGAYEQVESLMKASEENNIDLISYSSPSQVSTERMAINLSLAEVKAKLRQEFGEKFTERIAYQNTLTEYKKDLAEDGETTYLDGNQIAEQIDSSRKKIVAKRVGAKAAKTFAISASIGLAVSEVTAFFDDSREGIVEGIIHKVSSAGESDAVHDAVSEAADNVSDGVPEGVPTPHYSQEAEEMLHGNMPTKSETLDQFMQEHGTGPINREWANGEDYNVFHDSAKGFFSGYTDNAVDAAGNHIDIKDALDNGHFKVLWSPIEGDGNPIELEFDRMADGINVENLRVPGGSEALNDLLMAKKGLIEFGVESTGSNGESVMTMLSSWPGERVPGSELFDVVDMNRAQELAQEISSANAAAIEAASQAAEAAAGTANAVAEQAIDGASNVANEIAANAPGMFLDGSNGALNAASYAATALGDMMSNANRRSAPTSERSNRVAESFKPSSNTYSEVLTPQEDAERVELKDLVDPSNAYAVDREKLQAYLLQERGSMPTHEMNRLLVWADTWNDSSKKDERQKLMSGEMSRDYDVVAAFSVLQTFGILPERHMYEKPVDIAPMHKTAFESDISEWGKDTEMYLKQKGKTDYAVREIMESVNAWKELPEDERSRYRFSEGNGTDPHDALVATLRTEGLLPPAEKASEPNEFGGHTAPFRIDDSDPVKLEAAFEKAKAESRYSRVQTMSLDDFKNLVGRWNGYRDSVREGAVLDDKSKTTRDAVADYDLLKETGFVELT